jgi:hypothetical protein
MNECDNICSVMPVSEKDVSVELEGSSSEDDRFVELDEGRQSSIDEESVDKWSMFDEHDNPMSNVVSKRETVDLLRLKLLVLVVLVVSASAFAASVFIYITRSETSNFETKLKNDAFKVMEAIGSSLDRTLGLLDSLSVTMVSYARNTNSTWPLVSLPDFGPRMAKLLPLTDAFLVVVLPIVYPANRSQWEEYAYKNNGWVNQSIEIQATWNGYYGPIKYDWPTRSTIRGDFGDIDANVR